MDDWDPNLSGGEKKTTDLGPLSHDNALVMVSGTLTAQQKISTNKISKIENVVKNYRRKTDKSKRVIDIGFNEIKEDEENMEYETGDLGANMRNRKSFENRRRKMKR